MSSFTTNISFNAFLRRQDFLKRLLAIRHELIDDVTFQI